MFQGQFGNITPQNPERLGNFPVLKSVQSTLGHLISTSVLRATFIRFPVEHRLFQYHS